MEDTFCQNVELKSFDTWQPWGTQPDKFAEKKVVAKKHSSGYGVKMTQIHYAQDLAGNYCTDQFKCIRVTDNFKWKMAKGKWLPCGFSYHKLEMNPLLHSACQLEYPCVPNFSASHRRNQRQQCSMHVQCMFHYGSVIKMAAKLVRLFGSSRLMSLIIMCVRIWFVLED